MYSKIRATFEVVTPMFIGDGMQEADSIRPTAIKGALRFWWRALVWPRIVEKQSNEQRALEELQRQEVILFGAAYNAKNESGGPGLFSLKFKELNSPKTELYWPKGNSGSAYITYGLDKNEKAGTKGRKAIIEGHQFTVELLIKPQISAKQKQSLIDSLTLFGRIGALGSRARRANGCVQLLELDGKNMVLNKEVYLTWLGDMLKQPGDYPPFTAFNRHTQYKVLGEKRDSRLAHNNLGSQYKAFRDTKQNPAMKGDKKIGFGLPIKDKDMENRRSSPLFMSIYKLAEGTFLPVYIYIPAVFHENYPQTAEQMYAPVLSFLQGAKV